MYIVPFLLQFLSGFWSHFLFFAFTTFLRECYSFARDIDIAAKITRVNALKLHSTFTLLCEKLARAMP